MIKKVTLEKVSRFTKDKEGNPFKTKDGKPYERMLLTVNGQTLSGFGGQWNAEWKAGDEVKIDITQVEKNGKTYYNFGKVDITSEILVRLEDLERDMATIKKNLTSTLDKVPDFSEVNAELETQAQEALDENPF